MSRARSRLSAARAYTNPLALEAQSEARAALAANEAAAWRALRSVVPPGKAAKLGERTVNTIASNLVALLRRAKTDEANLTLLQAMRSYQQCLRAAAPSSGADTLPRIHKCCVKHLGLHPEHCQETAVSIERALKELRSALPSQRAYAKVVGALFTAEAGTNWARLFAAAAVWAGTVAAGYSEHKAKMAGAEELRAREQSIMKAAHEQHISEIKAEHEQRIRRAAHEYSTSMVGHETRTGGAAHKKGMSKALAAFLVTNVAVVAGMLGLALGGRQARAGILHPRGPSMLQAAAVQVGAQDPALPEASVQAGAPDSALVNAGVQATDWGYVHSLPNGALEFRIHNREGSSDEGQSNAGSELGMPEPDIFSSNWARNGEEWA